MCKVFEVETLWVDLWLELLHALKRMGVSRGGFCQASVLSVVGQFKEDLGRAFSPLHFNRPHTQGVALG